jgi:phosphatidylinositol alpha 1,6-mannosyltransferase
MSAGGGGRPLRVALVTSSYNYIPDGVALTLNRLVGYLESRGVEVLVFAPVAKAPAFAHQGDIVPAPSAPFPFRPEYRLALGLTRRPRERLAAFDPDIIHIAVPDFLGRQALAIGRARGRPVVASYHTRYEAYLKDYGLEFLREGFTAWLRQFYDQVDEVYVPSESMIESLRAEGFLPHLHLWRRGVDVERFTPGKRSAAARQAWGVGNDDVAITFVSRLVREKRLDTLVEVADRLSAAGIRHRMVIVGEGPSRAALERRLPRAVFAGFLAGEALAQAYASSDIFLFPSDTESFGNVTLEAMASGLPAVCADATGSRSLVKDGVTGFLAPVGNGEAFFGHVATLAADESLRRRMGAAARTRALGFSWDETMAGLLARYQALVTAPHRAAA